MRKQLTIIAAFCSFCCMRAETLSLQSCIDNGLQNNYSIQLVRLSEEQSSNNNTYAAAGGLPTVDLTAGYSSNTYGRNTYDSDNNVSKSRGVTDQTLNAQAGASWTLFNGFKIKAAKSRLEELERIGEIQTRIAIEDLVANLATEYYNLVRQHIHKKNLDYAVQLSKERLRIVQERYNIGGDSRLGLQQAKVYFNADSAKSLKQREAIGLASTRIRTLMSSEALENLLTTSDTTITMLERLDYQELLEGMLATNSKLLNSESKLTVAELDRKAVLSRNYPYLRLSANYGYTHNIYDTGATAKRDNWGPTIGATAGFNLFDGNRRRDSANARIQVLSAEISTQELELQLRANLFGLWQSYENNLKLLQLEQENLHTAEENLSIAQERYMLGELSGLDMREAQVSLQNAEESLLSAAYNAKVNEISLLQISGGIMRYLE